MATMTYIGIDPGASGGLALIRSEGNSNEIATTKMPDTNIGVWSWLSKAVIPNRPCRLVLERVTGYLPPKRGSREEKYENHQPGSAMFNFGTSYGGLTMCCTILAALYQSDVQFQEVTPGTWQRIYKAGVDGYRISPREPKESKEQWKRRLKQLAEKLFPAVKVTLNTADALLLAWFAKNQDDGAGGNSGRNSAII